MARRTCNQAYEVATFHRSCRQLIQWQHLVNIVEPIGRWRYRQDAPMQFIGELECPGSGTAVAYVEVLGISL